MGGWRRGPNEISRYVNAGWLRRASSYERRRWNGPGTRYEREICRGSGSLDVCNAYAETGPLPRLVFLALSASYICSTPFDVLRLLFSPFNAILGYEGRLPRIRTRVALISGNGTFHDNGRALPSSWESSSPRCNPRGLFFNFEFSNFRLVGRVLRVLGLQKISVGWWNLFFNIELFNRPLLGHVLSLLREVRLFVKITEVYSSILNFSIFDWLDVVLGLSAEILVFVFFDFRL